MCPKIADFTIHCCDGVDVHRYPLVYEMKFPLPTYFLYLCKVLEENDFYKKT